MQVRRRSGDMGEPVALTYANASTKRQDGPSQVKTLRNAVSKASPAGPGKVRNAVSGPKR
jgi:hypothetical protein